MTRSGPVSLLALGGTISMRLVDGRAVPSLGAGGIAALLGTGHGLRCVDVTRVGGSQVDFGHLHALTEAVGACEDSGAGGAIVTTGTDSIEEVSAWLTYTGPWSIPVVVTGAMRPGAEPGGDARANLSAALAAVRAPLTREPMVAFAGRIWLGRAVQKVSGTGPDAFATPGVPALGNVDEHGVVRVLTAEPTPATTLGVPGTPGIPVPLVTAAIGAGGDLLEHAGEGAHAVVVAGNGAGNLPPAMADAAVGLVASGTTVAVATRAADACTDPLYGYPGAGGRLADAGVILTSGMTPHRARVFLGLAIAHGWSGTDLRTVLRDHLESLS